MLQRIALYATLGYLLDALSVGWDHWGFWCVLALFIAAEHMTRRELVEQLNQELQAMREKAASEQQQEQDNK